MEDDDVSDFEYLLDEMESTLSANPATKPKLSTQVLIKHE